MLSLHIYIYFFCNAHFQKVHMDTNIEDIKAAGIRREEKFSSLKLKKKLKYFSFRRAYKMK